jgi:arylsulfatase A-like enzyme
MITKRPGAARSLLVAVFLCLWIPGPTTRPVVAQTNRPNVILVNLDDADTQLLSPATMAERFPHLNRFALEGIRFTNMHVTTPLCGPSRASLFRGQYAHRTGIRVNDPIVSRSNGFDGGMRLYRDSGYDEDDLSTWMKSAGYRTMMVGKFLHGDVVSHVPAGWDDFHSSLSADYFGTQRFTNRTNPAGSYHTEPANSYRTTVEGADAIDLIETHAARGNNQPFFLYFAPLAPHTETPGSTTGMVHPQYEALWPDLPLEVSPDFDEIDLTDKTSVMQAVPRLNATWLNTAVVRNRQRHLAMKSVDDFMGELFDTLQQLGIEDETYILLTSDNGYCNGHHRIFGKGSAFRRSTGVPMYVLGPDVAAGATANHLLAHIDIAPTIAELGGQTVPGFVDGKSFRSLISNPQQVAERDWRQAIMIQNWESLTLQRVEYNFASIALRMYDSVYVEWAAGTREFYNLAADPFQLNNVYNTLTQTQKDFYESFLKTMMPESRKPVTTISSPFGMGSYMNRKSPFSGLAEDDEGISRVVLVIRRISDWQYWNGQTWQPGYVRVDAKLANPGQQLTEWTYDKVPLVSSDEILGIWARSYDLDRENDSSLPWVMFQIDHLKPVSQITEPVNNAVQNTLTVSGTSADERLVVNVRLVIRNKTTGKYWSGAQWVDSWTYLLLPVSPRTQGWSYTNSAITGSLTISVRAVDDSGNVQSTPSLVDVRVGN